MKDILKNKKILIILTIILGLGISLSAVYFMYYYKDTRVSNLTSELISIDFKETNNVILSSDVPVIDDVGLSGTPYEFEVTNTSKVPININIKVNTTTNSKIPLSAVRYGLYINNELVKKDYIHEDKLLYTFEELFVDEKIECKLYFWIDYYYEEPNKKFEASIIAEGESRDIIWEPITVTFAPNGGTLDTTEKVVGIGSNYGRLPTPVREGYTFDGWTIPDAEYQELEYIESSRIGNQGQYIDTGYKPGPNTGIETEYQFTSITPTQQTVFGTDFGDDSVLLSYSFYISDSGYLAYAYQNGQGNWVSTFISVDTNKHNLKFNIDGKVSIDETLYSENIEGTVTNTSEYNLMIMASSQKEVVNSYSSVKIYSFKIYENSILVRDFVPVIKISTGEIGLYDWVTQEFYGNMGEGSFISGPLKEKTTSKSRVLMSNDHELVANWIPSEANVSFDANGGISETTSKKVTYNELYGVLPTPTREGYTFDGWTVPNAEYQELEYIESYRIGNQGQYIDTGYKPGPNTGIETEYEFTSVTPTQQRVFGTEGADSKTKLSYSFYINSGGNWAYAYQNGQGNWFNTNVLANTRKHKLKFNINGRVSIDESLYSDKISGTATNKSQYNLMIMARSHKEDIGCYSNLKIYSFKIYESGKLVMDFVPVLKISTKKIGLLDKINNKFYGNSGVGNFEAGPLVNKTTSSSKVLTSSNHTIFAAWIPNRYNVKYHANGGTGSMEDSVGIYNNLFLTSPNTFSLRGHTFNGWNEKADGTGVFWRLNSQGIYENEAHPWTWTYTNDINLYAQWQPTKYYIRYHGNGGTSTYTEPWTSAAFTYGTTYSKIVENNWYTRSGYTFTGWAIKSGNSTWWPAGYPSTPVAWTWVDGEYGVGDEEEHYVDLYAQWRAN